MEYQLAPHYILLQASHNQWKSGVFEYYNQEKKAPFLDAFLFHPYSFATIEQVFSEGLPDIIVGSDRLAAQLKITSKAKQLCLPHLFRDLNYLLDVEKLEWAQKFKDLLKEALDVYISPKVYHVLIEKYTT